MSAGPVAVRNVPTNVRRKLWAEAIGHCMNPECQAELINNGTSIGEMAHIKSHADGGDVSFENLILLCTNCHTQADANNTKSTTGSLQKWKSNRNSEIERQFTKRHSLFENLKESVTPILIRNGQIFVNYGPNDASQGRERHNLWIRFEGEIIRNNRQLELILTTNKDLLHEENQEIVDAFVAHAREFVETRNDDQIPRVCLFPRELLSIFGIAEARIDYPPNLSALQNFVSHLINTNRFVRLELNINPHLAYRDENRKVVKLMLDNRPRVQQIFWNGRFFRPQSTDVRIRDLIFFVNWLRRNKIQRKFTDMHNLTALTLNDKLTVWLCYKYVLSISDVRNMTLQKGDKVVNLHNWNGAPVSDEAHKYASQIGVQLFSQDEFFVFALKNLK